jgi:hypothetical protein
MNFTSFLGGECRRNLCCGVVRVLESWFRDPTGLGTRTATTGHCFAMLDW